LLAHTAQTHRTTDSVAAHTAQTHRTTGSVAGLHITDTQNY